MWREDIAKVHPIVLVGRRLASCVEGPAMTMVINLLRLVLDAISFRRQEENLWKQIKIDAASMPSLSEQSTN